MKLKRYRKEHTWLAAREKLITSSDIPVLLGIGYGGRDPLHLYYEKRGELYGEAKEVDDKMQVRFAVGHALEPLITDLAEKELGIDTIDPGKYAIATSSELPWAGCSPDRFIMGVEAYRHQLIEGILEEKTVITAVRYKWEHGPDLYALSQLIWQLQVCGLEQGAIAALIGFDDLRIHEVDLNEYRDIADQIMDMAWAFHKRLKEGNPPPATHASKPALKMRYPQAKRRTTVVLPGEAWEQTASMYEMLRVERNKIKKLLEQVNNELGNLDASVMLAIKDADGIEAGRINATWKNTEPSTYTVNKKAGRKLNVRISADGKE